MLSIKLKVRTKCWTKLVQHEKLTNIWKILDKIIIWKVFKKKKFSFLILLYLRIYQQFKIRRLQNEPVDEFEIFHANDSVNYQLMTYLSFRTYQFDTTKSFRFLNLNLWSLKNSNFSNLEHINDMFQNKEKFKSLRKSSFDKLHSVLVLKLLKIHQNLARFRFLNLIYLLI